MSEPPTQEPGAGRRSVIRSKRRVDLLVALAIVLPAIVALSVSVIGEESDPSVGGRPPTTSTLTSATIVCPAGLSPAAGPVRAMRAPGVAGGMVSVRAGGVTEGALREGETIDVGVGGGGSVVSSSRGAAVLDGKGDAAPGLVAGRGDRLAVPECRSPSYDEWLVGLNASARYATTLELVNPDEGVAVVDVELVGAGGPIDEPGLRGIQVSGHSVKRVEFAKVAPRSAATAAHLTVIRGRVTATARNTLDPLGRGRVTTDFLPAVTEPATTSLMLGIPDRAVNPTLFLVNPGDDEVRVTTRLVTPEAVFTPIGAEEIAVAPHAMKAVRLNQLLSGASAKGTVGLQLESTGPIASSLRLIAQDDLVLLAPAPELREPAAAVLPQGAKTLVLGGATRTGVVRVKSYDASGEELADRRVEVGPDRAATLALPPKAVAITVETRSTRIAAVVSIPTKGPQPGLATIRLRPAELQARIPVVGPQ